LKIIRHIAMLGFAAVLLLQAAGQSVLIAGFYINRSYIAKNLCEQREISGNCCQGSCHLRKQLKEDTQKDGLPLTGNSKVQNEIQVVLCNPAFPSQSPPVAEYFHPHEMADLAAPVLHAVFHPPESVTCS
jgi:hypothetical protein